MIKKLIFLAIFSNAWFGNAQKNIFDSTHFDELSANHQVLAIIPFLTQLDLEQNTSQNELKSLAKKEGYAVQDAFE